MEKFAQFFFLINKLNYIWVVVCVSAHVETKSLHSIFHNNPKPSSRPAAVKSIFALTRAALSDGAFLSPLRTNNITYCAPHASSVTPSDTVVRRSFNQQSSGVSITIDDPIRTTRQLSPPHGKVSNIIHITNLVGSNTRLSSSTQQWLRIALKNSFLSPQWKFNFNWIWLFRLFFFSNGAVCGSARGNRIRVTPIIYTEKHLPDYYGCSLAASEVWDVLCIRGVSWRRDITHLMTSLAHSPDNCITDGGLESCMWLNQFSLSWQTTVVRTHNL